MPNRAQARPPERTQARARFARVGRRFAAALILLALLRPSLADAALFGWALDRHDTPTELWVGVEVEVEITVRNLGNHPWVPSLGDRLSYHWRTESGELLIRDGLRTEIPDVIGVGESVELLARLRPPEEPGRYQLEWAIVREGVTWFPPPSGGPIFHTVEVEAGEFGWQLIQATKLPERMTVDQVAHIHVALENTGSVPWEPARGDAIASHWWSDEGELWVREGRRTRFPSTVAPGDSIELDLEIVAPSHAGPEPRTMCVELEPLRERVRWYGPASAGPVSTKVVASACVIVEPDPLAWALLAETTPTRLSIGDAEQIVSVTVQNRGTEPWPAGDRLAYRWRSRATGIQIDGLRLELEHDVEPGEIVELEPSILAPDKPGEYELTWGLVREGERWYPTVDEASVTRIVDVGGERLAWALLQAEPIPRVWVNGTTTVEVELQNLGTESWSEATGDHLAYHWLDAAGQVVEQDGSRTSFAASVAPGERVIVDAKVRGPARPGHYRLQWELVREHERWFGPPAQIGAGLRWEPKQLEPTRARWSAIVVALGLALTTVLGAIGLRLRPPTHAWAPTIVEQLPLVWTALALVSLIAAFYEFSAIDPWAGAWWIAGSGVGLPIAMLALTRHRLRAWSSAGLIAFAAVLAFADLVYMHYFGSIVPVVALTASHHLGEVGDSAIAELERVWGWLAVVPLAGIIAAAIWPSTRLPESSASWRSRAIAAGIALLFATPMVVTLGAALGGELGKRVFSEQAIVGRYGYLNAHLFDLARTVRERGRRGNPSPAERERIATWFAEHQLAVDEMSSRSSGAEMLARSSTPEPVANHHNLLLIQVEALQTWVIGLEVEGQEITPLLNRMRDEADWYPYLIDQTNQGKTSDAEYAVLNSQHPLGEGAICFLRADNQFHTLAHVLAEHGYSTVSAHPYKRGFWNRAVLHPRYGFERSLFDRELGDGQDVGWGLADGLFFERMVPELLGMPEPWFGFLITLSLHHPYDDFPDNLDMLDLGPLEGTRVGNYLEALHYFDRSLAVMLAELEDAGELDNTVVALYGDHDARFELDEYPEVLALSGGGEWDPAAFARLERVPLFVRVPAKTRAAWGEVEVVGGHVDVAPTVLHALGLARPSGIVGRPLVPGTEDEGFAAYPDGSAYSRDRMYVATGKGIPIEGGCFEFPEGESRPLDECRALIERAKAELEVSRMVVDHDLHRALER